MFSASPRGRISFFILVFTIGTGSTPARWQEGEEHVVVMLKDRRLMLRNDEDLNSSIGRVWRAPRSC